jgi:NucS shadow ORF
MSLSVPVEVQERAERGIVEPAEFVAVVRDSLPWAYGLVASLAGQLSTTDREFVDNLVEPPDEQARGQLLRALASDAIRGALEDHFGVRLAFQNCHRVAVFRPGAETTPTYAVFTSPRAQLLNQRPELVSC